MACESPLPPDFIPPHRRVKLTDMPEANPRTASCTVMLPHHRVVAERVAATKAEGRQQDAVQISRQPVTPSGESRSSATNLKAAAIDAKTQQDVQNFQQPVTFPEDIHSSSTRSKAAGERLPAVNTKTQQELRQVSRQSIAQNISTQPNIVRPVKLHCTATTDGGVSLRVFPIAPHHNIDARNTTKASAGDTPIPVRVMAPHHTVKQNKGVAIKPGNPSVSTSSPLADSAAAIKMSSDQQNTGQEPPPSNDQNTTIVYAQPKVIRPAHKANNRWVKNSEIKRQEQLRKKALNPPTNNAWAAAWNVDTTTFNGVVLPKYTGLSLLNYDGTWAPPPEDWDSRPAFSDHQFTESIKTWLASVDVDPAPLLYVLNDPESSNFHQALPDGEGVMKRYYFVAPNDTQAAMGEIVPQAVWIPDSIEGYASSGGDFWDTHLGMPLLPCDTDDSVDVEPWWKTLIASTACFLVPLEHPQHKGIDITFQSREEIRKFKGDRGSNHFIERWMGGWRPHHKQGRGRGHHTNTKALSEYGNYNANGARNETLEEEGPIPDLSIKPKVTLYLRRAQISDLAQITEIYNHYVTNTCRVPECAPVLPSRMRERLRCIKAVSHTFIVACLASGPSLKGIGRGPGRRSNYRDPLLTDRIIGFAYSDDFNDAAGMYRFLAEIEVFTHPGYTRKGVASCLLDKLVAILDPYWISRGGYEIRDNEMETDASRTVSALWINLPYVPEEDEKEWAGKWLERCGFEQTGDHQKVAFKIGKCANLAVYTRATGCEINPKQPPVRMADNLLSGN